MGILVHKPNYFDECYRQNNPVVVTAFYHFCNIESLDAFQVKLYGLMQQNNIFGTVILGNEGVNGTVAGLNVDCFYDAFKDFDGMEFKESYYHSIPFKKIKVKIKPEIVTMGAECVFNPGYYIEPEEWADFISRSDVVTVDTRNDYEYHIGTFKGAVNPKTSNFREFVEWFDNNQYLLKDKKIAMFCTGGIRCEKSTSLLKTHGFESVYHLKGGILNYFLRTQNKSKAWVGDCFVFDNRIIVNDRLEGI